MLGWHRLAMVELKLDSNTQLPISMEVNPRVWGSIFQSIAGCCNPKENGYAFELARRYGKQGIFDSDAHLKREIGIGYCEMGATVDFSSIRAGILKGATSVYKTCSPK